MMRDFLEYIGIGVLVTIIWVLTIVVGLACLLLPVALMGESHDAHWLWLYAGSIPLLGTMVGAWMWAGENV